MLECLHVRKDALQFIDKYGVDAEALICTEVGIIKQTNRTLEQTDRLLGNDPISRLADLNARRSFRVLDLPCGRRAQTARDIISKFENANVVGVDLTIDEPSDNPRLSLIQEDFFKMEPVDNESIDLAISYGFLDYLREARRDDLIKEFLLKVSRSLAPGGVAFIDGSYKYICQSRNRSGAILASIVEREASVGISSKSRQYPFGIRFPVAISWSNFFQGRLEPDYILIEKSPSL